MLAPPKRGETSLVLLDGKHCGKSVLLPPKIFVIGRLSDCHLRVASRMVSRRHCALAPNTHGVTIRDLKSRNGTFVNGQSVHGQLRLSHGDELRIGPVRFSVYIPQSPTLINHADFRQRRRDFDWMQVDTNGETWKNLDTEFDTQVMDSPKATTDGDAPENNGCVEIAAGDAWQSVFHGQWDSTE